MAYRSNNSKLGSYLTPSKPVHRSGSYDQAFANSIRSKYVVNDQANIYTNFPARYPVFKTPQEGLCSQCQNEKRRPYQTCSHVPNQAKGTDPSRNIGSNNEYYEIKTIRNTLMDIRDELKSKQQQPVQLQALPPFQQTTHSYYDKSESVALRAKEQTYKRKIEEKQGVIKGLETRIMEIERLLGDLQRKNIQLQDDCTVLGRKNSDLEIEVEQQKSRANRMEIQKLRSEERERNLQVKMMDLRTELMRKQQALRDLDFQDKQQRHMQTTRQLMLGPLEQANALIHKLQMKPQTKGAQTILNKLDIEEYREVNRVQDQLCDRINGNLNVEKKIFAHIQQLEENLNEAYDRLYRIQEEAFKAGLVLS